MRVPVYHPSYDEKDNELVHEYVNTASKNELINAIEYLRTIYLEDEGFSVNYRRLLLEIKKRIELKSQYDILEENKMEWVKYVNRLWEYKDALYVRKKYNNYRRSYYKMRKGSGESIYEMFKVMHCEDKIIRNMSESKIKKCVLLSSKNGIQKPEKTPVFYETNLILPYRKIELDKALNELDIASIRYLLQLLLYRLDSKQSVGVKAELLFIRYAFSKCSKKGKEKLTYFHTDIPEENVLVERITECNKMISDCKIDAEKLLEEIEKMETELNNK